MRNEVVDLTNTLKFIVDAAVEGSVADRARIVTAYAEARDFVASLGSTSTPSKRIDACFKRYKKLSQADDFAAVGWLFVAVEERISEHNLPGWQDLRAAADVALTKLGLTVVRLQ